MRIAFVVDVVGSVEMVSTRQEEILGVYNGVPGFGFSRARYYINATFREGTFLSILPCLKRRFKSRIVPSVRPRIIAPEVFLSNLYQDLS